MIHQQLSDDAWLFVGNAYESAATAFVNEGQVFLVDGLASEKDARWMRDVIESLGLKVSVIATTHYMSDHMAAIGLFPNAMTIAQQNYRHTFLSQNSRIDEFYVEPAVTFDGRMDVRWGRHHIRLIHNPGKTMDHVSVDVPEEDLVCAGDNIVGNIVYLSKADPNQIDHAIETIQRLGRKWVISAHMGKFAASALGNARHYLAHLREAAICIRRQHSGDELARRLGNIRIEDCLPAGIIPCGFEREWHQNNLALIREQGVFELDAFGDSRRHP